MAKINNGVSSKVIVSPDIGPGWIVERTGPRSSITWHRTSTEAIEHAREEVALRGGELEVYGVAEQTDQTQIIEGNLRRRRANARG